MQEATFQLGDIAFLVSVIGSSVALIAAFSTSLRKSRANDPAIVEMRADIKYIRSSVDKQEGLTVEQARRIDEHERRLANTEASINAVHRRLDELSR